MRSLRPGASDLEEIVREKKRAAASSVLAGLALTVVKLFAGLSTSSLGLLAEAAHSALDFGAAVMTWLAVRHSWRPPDAEHHYGHGKIENLSALGETILLAATSFWILYEAGQRLAGRGPEVQPSILAFAVMGLSIVVDVVRSRDLRRVAAKSGSQALEADALHFSTDIASSTVVIVGLVGVLAGRHAGLPALAMADPIAAIIVALIVLVLSWKLGRKAVDMLLDRAPSGVASRLASSLEGIDGLERAPVLRVRQAGDRLFVDVDVALRRGLPVAEVERVAATVRERVTAASGTQATVTVQIRASEGTDDSVRARVAIAVAMEGVHAHNITLRGDPDGLHADFHLELPSRLSLGDAHAIADRVESRVLREVPDLGRVDIHLELHDEVPGTADPLEEPLRSSLESRVLAAARGVSGAADVHDLVLYRTGEGIYLSCHCFVPSETSLAEAHAVTEKLEREIRAAVPELGRVSVHAEPPGSEDWTRRPRSR